MAQIKLNITNWEKYQSRKDIKNPLWFKMPNRIFEDKLIQNLDPLGFEVMIYCFCLASIKQNSIIDYDTKYLTLYRGHPESCQIGAIEILIKIGMLFKIRTRSVRDPYVIRTESVQDLNVIHDVKLEKVQIKKQKPVSEKNNQVDPGLDLRREIWKTYTECYEKRYNTKPVGNAMTAKQVQHLANRLGREAIDVVEFYLQHNKAYYTERCHPIGLCLSDAESLRTQWSRGRAILASEAKNFERKQANTNVFDEAIRILNERKSGEKDE